MCNVKCIFIACRCVLYNAILAFKNVSLVIHLDYIYTSVQTFGFKKYIYILKIKKVHCVF